MYYKPYNIHILVINIFFHLFRSFPQCHVEFRGFELRIYFTHFEKEINGVLYVSGKYNGNVLKLMNNHLLI